MKGRLERQRDKTASISPSTVYRHKRLTLMLESINSKKEKLRDEGMKLQVRFHKAKRCMMVWVCN